MKAAILIFFSLLFLSVNAQDFNIEYKAYLLQSFFKERQIQSLAIEKSGDSLFKNRSIQYTLHFDREGRLIKIYDYYFDTDTIPERIISYDYSGSTPHYTSKEYQYLDGYQNVIRKRPWLCFYDQETKTMRQEFLNGTEKFRTNNLVFNQSMQMMSRTVQAYIIKLRTGFAYNKNGLLQQVQIVKENPTVERLKRLELNQYLQYNNFQKVLNTEQWLGAREKQISEYFFNYNNDNITAKVGWSLMNWSDSDKKRIERTNFTYHKNGLVKKADYFNEKQVSTKHKYTGFKYTFFGEAPDMYASSNQFITLWFTDVFAENLIHP